MTGVVERSSSKYINFQTTHLAFVRRTQHDQCNKHDPNMASSSNKNNHLRFLTNLSGKMIPINHIHQLDNQFHSVRRLPHNFSDHRYDSTSSHSSTSTFVDECDDNSGSDLKHETTASKKEVLSTSNKKCCPIQCIDAVSTVSSVCPPCPDPVSNCFNRPALLSSKDNHFKRHNQNAGEREPKRISPIRSFYKSNFSSLVTLPYSSPYKVIASRPLKHDSTNSVRLQNSRVPQFIKSPFKEWLL